LPSFWTGLLAIPLRHGHAAPREPSDEVGLECRIDRRDLAESRRDGLACKVVLRRSEASGRHDQIAPANRSLERLLGAHQVVPDGLHMEAVDAKQREPAGEVVRIRVDDLAEQQLGPDRQELSLQRHDRASWLL